MSLLWFDLDEVLSWFTCKAKQCLIDTVKSIAAPLLHFWINSWLKSSTETVCLEQLLQQKSLQSYKQAKSHLIWSWWRGLIDQIQSSCVNEDMAYDFRYSKTNLESLLNQLVFSPLESHEVAYRKHGASHKREWHDALWNWCRWRGWALVNRDAINCSTAQHCGVIS